MSALTTSQSTPSPTHRSPSPSSSAAPSSACAACKYQRRKCTSDCTLAPFFPADKQRQFLNVHRLFGVSNIHKILKSVDKNLRQDAMNSIIFQSNIRAQDPAGGCYRIILDLQRQIDATLTEIQCVLRQIAFFRAHLEATGNSQPNHLLSSAAADVDAIYGQQQQQQQYYNNHYFNYEVQQDMQEFHEHSNNSQNVTGGFDNDYNTINIGNDEQQQQILFSFQQKEEGEEDVDVRPLADMSEMRHVLDISEEREDPYNNINIGSPVTALSSSKNQVKPETSLVEQLQEHDLKNAASFFKLTNCNASSI